MKHMVTILISISLIAIVFSGCVQTDPDSMQTTTATSETMTTTTAPAETTPTTTTPAETTPVDTMTPTETMETTVTYQDLTPAEAKELIDNTPDLIIIDVSPNYDEGHLPGAVNYYAGDGSLDEAIPSLDKDKTYLVYCHVDSVSILGAQKLIDAGFTSVYRLAGNYAAWVDAGYEIEK